MSIEKIAVTVVSILQGVVVAIIGNALGYAWVDSMPRWPSDWSG